jgi:DNA-binding winged helix-turn-helix (wHTH) protein
VQLFFGGYSLDFDRRELRSGSDLVAMEPQVFDVLAYLVKNRDRVVSKDDLFAAVWQGRIVSESTLTSRINAARKAVGDSGEHQAVIRTIARKGFRFIGAIKEDGAASTKEAVPRVPIVANGILAAFAATLPMTEKPELQAEDAQT